MYGQCTVNSDFTTAQPEMKHALSLVRIKVVRDEYLGEGVITDMAMDNVPRSLIWTTYQECLCPSKILKEFLSLSEADSCSTTNTRQYRRLFSLHGAQTMVFHSPSVWTGSGWNMYFQKLHRWEMGMIYTYTIKIKGEYNAAVNREDVPIDVQYWSQFGKTDDIVLKEIGFR